MRQTPPRHSCLAPLAQGEGRMVEAPTSASGYIVSNDVETFPEQHFAFPTRGKVPVVAEDVGAIQVDVTGQAAPGAAGDGEAAKPKRHGSDLAHLIDQRFRVASTNLAKQVEQNLAIGEHVTYYQVVDE